jgi:hypothetical protein
MWPVFFFNLSHLVSTMPYFSAELCYFAIIHMLQQVKDRVKQKVLLRAALLNGLYASLHIASLGEITPAYIWHLIYLT